MLDSPLLNIAYWHDLLKSTSLGKISLKLKISIKPNQLHYPTWNPWLKITERPLFKHPVKTSKGFGDFKHPLKTSIQAKWVETFRQLAPSKIFRKSVPSYAKSNWELRVQEGKTERVWIYVTIKKKVKTLVSIFWSHSQFGLYILMTINLVPIILNL